MTSSTFLERARARNPLPTGALVAGAGFVVAGLTIYVFLAVAARSLGATRYAGLSAMWAVTFLATPGFFFPVEQELARAVSSRRALGVGALPVLRRAAVVTGGLVAILVVGSAVASPVIVDVFFDGEALLLLGFVVAAISYGLLFLTRGTLAGTGEFSTYGVLIGLEGLVRLTGGVVLAVVGVATAGPYGLVVGIAPLAAALAVAPRGRGRLADGPEASWAELSHAFWYLLVGSVMAQVMINVAPLLVTVLGDESQRELVGSMLIALIVARVPVFLFQAVQASLIPQLAALAAEGRWEEFKERLFRLVAFVAVLGVAATVGALLLGPWVVRTFFGEEFELGRGDMAMLAAASGAFMLAMALAQALISISGYRRAAVSWVMGVATLFVVTAFPGELLARVERGFLVGGLVASALMAFFLVTPIRRHETLGEPEFLSPGGLPEA